MRTVAVGHAELPFCKAGPPPAAAWSGGRSRQEVSGLSPQHITGSSLLKVDPVEEYIYMSTQIQEMQWCEP